MPAPLSEQLLGGIRGALPIGTLAFADEVSARTALEDGEVSAVLLFPAEFSRSVMSPGAVEIRFIASQHLSLAETQFTGSLSRQIAASLSVAIAGVRLASANGQFPPGDGAEFALPPGADVSVELLHVAREPAALAATFVMTFATWIAAFVGALLAFLATRAVKGPETILPVSALRSVLPVIVSAIASSSLAIVVAWTTANWPSFIEIWLLVWLATAAITLLIAGLFALFGFFAILLALPAVFYQSALSGTQIPISAAPGWLQNIAEALPFDQLGTGYRTVIIGGPEGAMPVLLLVAVGLIGLGLIWAGTFSHHRADRGGAAAVRS